MDCVNSIKELLMEHTRSFMVTNFGFVSNIFHLLKIITPLVYVLRDLIAALNDIVLVFPRSVWRCRSVLRQFLAIYTASAIYSHGRHFFLSRPRRIRHPSSH